MALQLSEDGWLKPQVEEIQRNRLTQHVYRALPKVARAWEPTKKSGNRCDYVILTVDGNIHDIEDGIIMRNFGYTLEAMEDFVEHGFFEEVILE